MKIVTVGRNPDNDVVISDARVSRVHLQIIVNDNGDCSVVDLNSANGTYVNGQKIFGEVRLQPSDTIRIGNTTLPWQGYAKLVAPERGNRRAVRPKVRTNRFLLWGIACVVFVVIAGGTGFYMFYSSKDSQERETQNLKEKQTLRQEVEQLEAKRLRDMQDEESYRQVLRDARDRNDKLAKANQKEADNAKKERDLAKKEKAESEEKARLADARAKKELKEKEIAQMRARESEENAKRAAEKVKQAEANAEKKKREVLAAVAAVQESNKTRELITKFYAEEYETINDKNAKQVCEQLKKEIPEDKSAKVYLKELFDNADNKHKEEIIEVVQSLKHKKK